MAGVVARTDAETNVQSAVVRRAPFHIPSLDGLRAVSFFLVFLAHAGLDRVVPGGFGVTVFFFLSGYLITTLMRMEVDKTQGVSLKHFYLRRAVRILPPFYLVLIVATALAGFGILRSPAPLQLFPVASQMLHFSNYLIAMHGWSGVAPGTGVYWSLAVEEHFYLVFPTVFLLFWRLRLTGRQTAFAFWGICALILVWRCVLVLVFHAGADRTYVCSDTRVDSIVFGCALAVWNNPILDRTPSESPRSPFRSAVLLSAGVALLLVTFVVRDAAFRETLRYSLQGIALTPIFVAAVRYPRWPIFRPLNWQPLRIVGTLSYSLYLVHQCALVTLEQHSHLPAIPRALLALAISCAIARAIYVFIVKPLAGVRRRLSATG
jgi:peptidoglycan/LPS O-acetylase OafA/YrhL